MARQWTIQIEYGPIKVMAELTLTWKDARDLAWKRLFGDEKAIPSSGLWEHHRPAEPGVVIMYSPDGSKLLSLSGFQNLRVGLLGRGFFFGAGFSIPAGAGIIWELRTIE